MEQQQNGAYALPWLARREKSSSDEVDPEFIVMLEELFRGAGQ